MKILCLIDSLGNGGAERQIIGLTQFLSQRGYDVSLVTYYDCNFYLDLMDKHEIKTINLAVKNTPLSKLVTIRRHIQKNRYDWVIAYKDGPTIIGCLLKMFGNRFRLIVSERNTTQSLTCKERIKFFLYKWANYIVPNSYAQERFIVEHFPKLKSKTVTITNFTDISYFTPLAHSSNSDEIEVITVARIAAQKNVLTYLDAVRKIVDSGLRVHFSWYGNVQSGQEEYGKLCFSKVQELNLENNFHFYPATTQIVSKYQSADIFCLPSKYEGYPNVICEAMSCGKPIAASRICDNPYIVEENNNALLFNPQDLDDMIQTLLKICSYAKEQLHKMGKESRKIAIKKFSEATFADKYESILKSY